MPGLVAAAVSQSMQQHVVTHVQSRPRPALIPTLFLAGVMAMPTLVAAAPDLLTANPCLIPLLLPCSSQIPF